MTESTWRAALSQARAQTCARCNSQGPHEARCTPWVLHWGEVRCCKCKAHFKWISKPPESDRGAWRLYHDAEAKYRPCQDLEAYLDALGLRWRHESRGVVLIGAVDDPTFTASKLTTDEREAIKALAANVRAANGWSADEWRWPTAYHEERSDQLSMLEAAGRWAGVGVDGGLMLVAAEALGCKEAE